MYRIRSATKDDIPAIVHLQAQSLKETLNVAPTHTIEEDFDYYSNVVVVRDVIFVAEADGHVVGYVGFRKDWVDHLRVDSRYHGRGIGRALLETAKQRYPYLQLWCFQHIPAREFYRRQGFVEIEHTDGRNNDEKLPDIRMEWRR